MATHKRKKRLKKEQDIRASKQCLLVSRFGLRYGQSTATV